MGTSTARRGPTTRLWRAAKRAATRYLAPESVGAVTAGEVVARYLSALEETPGQGDRLAAFRFTRKVAQDLGAFGEEVRSRGLEEVLYEHGLAPLTEGDAGMLAQGLSGILAGRGGGLEEAVVRTTLALVLRRTVQSQGSVSPAQLVREFLATALKLRLILDLGEPLEAAAGSFGRLKEGISRVMELIEDSVLETKGQSEPPAAPAQWQGLAGWIWVTEVMTALLGRLGD